MLAIRMQRTGRTGHAQFRLIVQDSRFSPKSGRVVAYIGSYNPHSKAVVLNKEKALQYLSSGAQPSPRLIKILKNEGVKLPVWVKEPSLKKRQIRNPEKLRKNRPSSAKAPEGKPAGKALKPEAEAKPERATVAEEATAKEPAGEAQPAETPETAEPKTEVETSADEPAADEPAPEEAATEEKPAPTPKGSEPRTSQDANVGAAEPLVEDSTAEDSKS